MRAAWKTGKLRRRADLAGEVEMRRGRHALDRDDVGQARVGVDVAADDVEEVDQAGGRRAAGRSRRPPGADRPPVPVLVGRPCAMPTMKSGPTRLAHGVERSSQVKRRRLSSEPPCSSVAAVGRGRPELVDAGGRRPRARCRRGRPPACARRRRRSRRRCGRCPSPRSPSGRRGAPARGSAEAADDRQPVALVPAGAPAEMGELDHHRRAVLVALVGEALHARARSRPCRRGGCRRRAGSPARRWPSPPSSSCAMPPLAFSTW